MTIKTAYRQLVQHLEADFGTSEAGGIARIILMDAFDVQDLHSQRSFNGQDRLEEILKRLKKHEPIQYIVGKAYFYGYPFEVNPDVLIPRPETEELVYWALDEQPHTPLRVLDIGTGCGCIPIALKLRRPHWDISGLDTSEPALEVARRNGRNLGAAVNWIHLDILKEEEWSRAGDYDLILSNPPYIPEKEKSLMQSNVLDHEPPVALFVGDRDPLLFYRKIGTFAMQHLTEGGDLYFECNEHNVGEVARLLESLGFSEVEAKKDIQDKDRLIKARR